MFKDLIKQFNFWVSIFCFILSFFNLFIFERKYLLLTILILIIGVVLPSIATNFIVIPASTVILYGVVLMALVFFWPWFQAMVCAVLVKVVAFMNAGVTWVASLPGAGIDGIRLNLAQLAMVYVAVFSLYVLSFYVRKMRWQRLV